MTTTTAREAEDLVAAELQRQSWQVLARNFRRIGSELDIVAEKQGTVAVIEVKARRFYTDPRYLDLTTLLPHRKIKALGRGTLCFVGQYSGTYKTIRLDLAVVFLNKPGRGMRIAYFADLYSEAFEAASRAP